MTFELKSYFRSQTYNRSKNLNLLFFDIDGNNFNRVNFKNGYNSLIGTFDSTNNFNLKCIEVDNPEYSTINWTDRDGQTTFSTDCDYLSTNDAKKNIFQIYPNPVKEKFIINTSNKIEIVEIYSQTGQLLKTSKSKEVNISNFPKENYLVKIKTNKETITQKIIKE